MAKGSSIEERLWTRAKGAIEELQGLREPKVEDIFTRRYYISPEDLLVENYLRPWFFVPIDKIDYLEESICQA